MESALIELTEAELELVTGGATRRPLPPPTSGSIVLVGVLQAIRQSASIQQQGGSVVIG